MPSLAAALAEALADGGWRAKARPEQLAPLGDWLVWLILAGRGFGKTRSGAEWTQEAAEAEPKARIALVGATAADVRDVMVEGESGILSIAPKWARPTYEPSKRRLTWPNGALATLYSADEPDRLRGPQHSHAWADEVAAWSYADDAWNMLMMGLRLGTHPRCLVTTTPRPIKIIKGLLARAEQDVVVTRGSTFDNAANLPPNFLATIKKRYEGTRLGRQEIHAEVLDDVLGALFRREWIERDRVKEAPMEFSRIVVAVDPAVTNKEGSDETGIVVAAKGQDGHAYVLEDLSGRMAPDEWARRAVEAYRRHRADRVIAEVNNGGALVENTLRVVEPELSYKEVHASRGKAIRAEPISALYEKHRVHHVGTFDELEEQMCAFASDFDRKRAGYSPDRLDALVWAVTELMVNDHFKYGMLDVVA
jgi:predicted phage terminase large subunit-like protein